MIVIPIRSIRLLDQYPMCDINASSFTANSTTNNMAAPNSSATQTTVPTAPATSAEGGSMAWMFVGIPAHPPKLERYNAVCPSAAAPPASQLPAPAPEWVSIAQLALESASAPTELSHSATAHAEVTSCPLHPDPMPGLWYMPNARGEYSMYAPACNGKGPKCHPAAPVASPMPGLGPTPNMQAYLLYGPECTGGVPQPGYGGAVPVGECPMADAPTALSHTVAAQAEETNCPLHPDPMPGLWYTPNARGEYSMYAPACNGKGPKCH